ncbi:tryptophan synthase subunit alpha [Planosporangium flavigriseum]|nr:tryptophan synthase subunit alpha [Planosporangium flavigriseum]
MPGRHRRAARRRRGLRGRRLQRDRHLPRVRPGHRRAAVRLRGRRRRCGDRPARGQHHRRRPGRAARREDVPAAGRGRPDDRVALDLGRAGLPGGRAGARVAGRHRPGDLRAGDRCRGDAGVPAAVPYRGHHPGDRELARPRRGAADRAEARGGAGAYPDDRGQPVRPRRQGRGDRRKVVRGPVSVSIAFEKAKAEGRAVLVGYLPAGFPTVDGGIAAVRAMVEAGVDVVEVGFPYSDPVMDGPTIQRAAEAALAGGVRAADVLRTVAAVADAGASVLVMSYWNPIERYGVSAFARDLAAAGGAGLITPDLIPDEADEWIAASDEHGLDRVFLVAPSSTDERVRMTTAACRGFVYASSVMGVTGARDQTSTAAPVLVDRVRRLSANPALPVSVGLGVRDGAQAAEVASFADGVIVGSALVDALLRAPDLDAGLAALRALAADLAGGVRHA